MIILSNGPSLNDLSDLQINTLCAGKQVFAVKQALLRYPRAQYHFINNVNLIEYQYTHQVVHAISRAQFKGVFGTYNHWHELCGKRADCLLETHDFGKSLTEPRPWGPGIMFELVIPMAIEMGWKEAVIVGWDMANRDHAIMDGQPAATPDWEIAETVEASGPYYDWCLSKGLSIRLLSSRTALNMPRTTWEDEV